MFPNVLQMRLWIDKHAYKHSSTLNILVSVIVPHEYEQASHHECNTTDDEPHQGISSPPYLAVVRYISCENWQQNRSRLILIVYCGTNLTS